MIAPPNDINSHTRLTTQIILAEKSLICKYLFNNLKKGFISCCKNWQNRV
jgi:hypothetical protein